MKCTECKSSIDSYLEAQMTSHANTEFELHVSTCQNCAEALNLSRDLLEELQNLVVPQPSVDFEQRVFKKVRDHYKEDKREHSGFRFAAGFATAAVFSLVIWFVLSVPVLNTQNEHADIVSVTLNQTHVVRLMIDAKSDLQQVQLSIELPEHMQLDGFPGRNELSWQTRLHRGPNILALPIMAIQQGEGTLTATLNYGDRVKTFSVLLKTNIEGAQHDRLDANKSV